MLCVAGYDLNVGDRDREREERKTYIGLERNTEGYREIQG